MRVSVETTTGLERRLTVGVPAERVDNEVVTRLKKAAREVRLDGFRPGKVPMKVVKQRFGAGVRQEVLGEVISQSFYEAVQQEEIRPAGQPDIEPKKMEEGSDLEFVAIFEVYPNVEVNPFESIKVEKLKAEIEKADIEKMIENLRSQQSSWLDVARPAVIGDQTNIDYVGSKGGEEFEGGTAQDSDLELGSGSMIPGFEDGVVGLAAGDTKVLSLSFPDDYHAEDLKGAAVEFKVTVNAVKEKTLPELDDEFFAKFGVKDGGGVEAFREEIKKNMERELTQGAKNKVKEQIMDGLIEANSFDVPKALITQEITTLKKQAFQQFGGMQDLDSSMLPDDLFSEQAERRVKLGLTLAAIVQKEEIKADSDMVRAAIEEMASSYDDKEEVINYYYRNEQQLAAIESMIIEDQVIEKILKSCVVTEINSNYEEVLRPRQTDSSDEDDSKEEAK